jgi:hypothetical protein
MPLIAGARSMIEQGFRVDVSRLGVCAMGAWVAPDLRRLPGGASDFGLRQVSRDRLPKAAHFLRGGAQGVELGDAPALASRILVLDPGKDQRGDQGAHFFKRLDAVLNPGGLSGRALVEQEHELGSDFRERRARSSAGP